MAVAVTQSGPAILFYNYFYELPVSSSIRIHSFWRPLIKFHMPLYIGKNHDVAVHYLLHETFCCVQLTSFLQLDISKRFYLFLIPKFLIIFIISGMLRQFIKQVFPRDTLYD